MNKLHPIIEKDTKLATRHLTPRFIHSMQWNFYPPYHWTNKMAKSKTPDASPVVPPVTTPGSGEPIATPVAGGEKPKRTRSPSIKWKVIPSDYQPLPNGEAPTNPLDLPVKVSKGGIRFEFLTLSEFLGEVVCKVPSLETAIKNPTLRQIIELVDAHYSTISHQTAP